MCEDGGMDEFAAAYLQFDAALTLTPGPAASGGPESLAAYPAREVAAAIARARHIRWYSRKPPAPEQTGAWDAWSELRWRWREDDREMVIGFSVRPSDMPGAAAIWAESPIEARCHYTDVARLALTLARRFPALRLRLGEGADYTPAEFLTSVAQARLAPALTSADYAIREQAEAARALYAGLLASAPQSVDADVAFAAAPFTILYADEQLLAVNKPAGVITHPTYKHPDGTLTDAVFAQQEAAGYPRPWLLHRLDKETSGVVLFARSDQARRSVVSQIERRTLHKRYLALVMWPPTLEGGSVTRALEGEVDAPLARDPLDRRRVIVTPEGQPSHTRYRALGVARGYALVQAEPVTGRTHQIRAHLAAIGAPLLGDAAYLPADSPARTLAPRVMLHAWRLDLRYPGSEEPWSVIASPPDDFVAVAEALGLGEALRSVIAEAATASAPDH